ncbi:MAG: hypothetical protein JSW39_27695 [Desulfobacterales bacterium]|nr:MAG: hypothetical protein JSW39_27695 [Desulfobacterales bacterium]
MQKKNAIFRTLAVLLGVQLILAVVATASQAGQVATIQRIGVQEARQKRQSGEALLVCSYRDGRCKKLLLAGALLRSQFEARLSSLSKKTEIIFYCA